MTDREEFMLADYFKLVTSLYKLFDKVWCGNKKYEIGYRFVSTLPSIFDMEKSWDCLIKDVLRDMCHTDDWYLWDEYADTVGGNWTRSLYELIGMFIRIKVGE